MEELFADQRKQNAKNKIPELRDEVPEISRISVMVFPILKFIHRKKTDRSNLFIIGGGMISPPRPGSIKKLCVSQMTPDLICSSRINRLCTDYPLMTAYEMIHETYRVMLREYTPDNISVLGTSSGGNLALRMVPYINDRHGDTPMSGYIPAVSPGSCADTEKECQKA